MSFRSITRSVTVLAWIGLILNPPSSPAQDLESEVRKMRQDLQALHEEVGRRASHEEELATRVTQLETTVAEQRKAAADRDAELAQKLSGREDRIDQAIKEVSASLERSGAPSAGLTLGGYFDIELRDDHAAEHPTFDQHRLILKLDAEISDWISFRSEIEIEGGGVDDFLTDNAIAVEFAELHFHFDPRFNLKAGALLVPFDRFNFLHDSPLQELTDRPLVDRFIIPTTWTESGIGAYGGFDVGWGVIDYDVIVSNGIDDDFDSIPGGGFRDARSSYREDNNDNKQVTGRIGATIDTCFLDALVLGGSAAFGKYDDRDTQSFTMVGFDWLARKGPFELLGEYASINLERGPAEIASGVPGGASGFYAQLNFHFFPECWRGATPFFTKQSSFTLAVRYNSIDTDDSGCGVDRTLRGDAFIDDARSWTFGINFRPTPRTVFKAEYQWFPERHCVDEADNDRLVFSIATYF